MNTFLDIMKQRRSQYTLGKEVPLLDDDLIKLIKEAVLYTPTSFNMQSNKVVILLHDQHERFWDDTTNILRTMVPADSFSSTERKMETFKAAYGTVLFFDDTTITQAFADQNPLYKENFPIFALESNGMLQFALWNILTEEGLGASLQHYNPLVDEVVSKNWKIPASWRLIAQMPFGSIDGGVSEKAFDDINERVHIYK